MPSLLQSTCVKNKRTKNVFRMFSLIRVSLLLLGTATLAGAIDEASTKTNVVFFLADDLGYNELNFMNETRGIRSPHLDDLARSGVILKDYYVQPICSPTRSALMTARYPIHLGTQANVIYWDTPWSVSLDNKYLSEYLQDQGFRTAMFGKWHLGMHRNATSPWRRGFDEHAGYLQGCGSGWTHESSCCGASSSPTNDSHFICEKGGGKDYRGYDWFSNNGVPDVSANGTRTAELMRTYATKFLRSRENETDPFFLYLPFQNIHGPYDVPKYWADQYANRTDLTDAEKIMYGYISEMDDVVGDVVDTLNRIDRMKDTLIVFSSDNGAPPANDVRGRNWPLRGHKSQIFEGGVKVPAFVSGGALPQKVRGTINFELYHVTDWLPTILHAVGDHWSLTSLSTFHIDGFDAWSSISDGRPSPREEVLYNINPLCEGGQAGPPKAGLRAKINGTNWKILSYCYTIAGRAGNNGNYTGPIAPPNGLPSTWPKAWGDVVLFDLDQDPSETTDVSEKHRQVVTELLGRLERHAKRSVEPMQWTKPYQGPDYECADCALRPSTGPYKPWTPWVP